MKMETKEQNGLALAKFLSCYNDSDSESDDKKETDLADADPNHDKLPRKKARLSNENTIS